MNVQVTVNRSSFMPIHYIFSDNDRDRVYDALSDVAANPYTDLSSFLPEIIRCKERVPNICKDIRAVFDRIDFAENPAFFLKNCPIDRDLPIFDHEDPVASKYRLKKTFVTEGFLTLFAEIVGTYPVGYATINGGDLFHDGYMKSALKDTQSQKSMVTLGFHNDLPNNKVRPNWVNIVCLRNSKANKVSTPFVRNGDLVSCLDEDTKRTLQRPIFYSPPEVIAVQGGKDRNDVDVKPIHYPDSEIPFVYFENRTTSDDPKGRQAIAQVNRLLHSLKEHVFLDPGDLVSINNNTSIHGREVIEIKDMEAHKIRWLLKTWNVNSLNGLHGSYVSGRPRVVNE